MNNPGVQEELWVALRQKWAGLVSQGHKVEVEFKLIQDPNDKSKTLAIDVAQNIDNEWHVQTVQHKAGEAHEAVGIQGFTLNPLLYTVGQVVNSLTEPITGHGTVSDEMHVFMKRISPESAEIYGHIISKSGEKIGVRSNYRHYYVFNALLEEISKIMKDEYSGIQLHRQKDDDGRIYFRFVPA
jgi:hypothetical protein